MELINSQEVKKIKDARSHIDDLQRKILSLENLLDDLSRSVEIARFSRQYDVVDVYVREAEEVLKDRIVLPEIKQADAKFTIVEGSISSEIAKSLADVKKAKIKK